MILYVCLYIKKYLHNLTQIYKDIYFKELDHMSVVAWQVHNLMGEAGRLESQEKVAVWVQKQSADKPERTIVADEVLIMENRFLLSGGQHFFSSSLQLIG